MMRLFMYPSDMDVMKHFYNTPFTGEPMLEEIRAKKVAKLIKELIVWFVNVYVNVFIKKL